MCSWLDSVAGLDPQLMALLGSQLSCLELVLLDPQWLALMGSQLSCLELVLLDRQL